ncbi:MAG: putative heme-binding domain-containing protein [Akkermansiaceae bacterium]|jgi:putative heme-binding domain-containing protein
MRRLLCAFLFSSFTGGLAAQGHQADDYRNHALRHEGDVIRGTKLFQSESLMCSKCHSVDGSASKAGPDLRSAGDAFGRRDLVAAVLDPSATIAPGYGTVLVETKDGQSHIGTLKQKTAEKVELMGMDGVVVTVAAENIKSQSGSAISLMPQGLHASLTRDEFTDLIDYLVSLKEPESALKDRVGMPREILELVKPIELKPFFKESFQLPRGKAETGLTSMRQVPGLPQVFLVLHQKGVIWRVEKTAASEKREVFSDLKTEVFSDRGPNGLLDVCFHPKFRENRKYYLYFQVIEEGEVTTRIVEKIFNDDFTADSGREARELIEIKSIAEDHSGGCLDFGPDGFLYFAMGDTGPHHDPNGHAQNPGLLLGKMMRIDVDHQDAGREYAIPQDNPFVGRENFRPEIWAYGLRNPWRFCFDKKTGDLWLADVGQDRVEEVTLIQKGGNYGWNVYEGFERFSNQYRRDDGKYLQPVFAYRHKYGNSITGGHVYRGSGNPSFDGVYICGDYNSKRLFGIAAKDSGLKLVRQIGTISQRLVSFAEDEAGNHYAIGYEGMIYRLNFESALFE